MNDFYDNDSNELSYGELAKASDVEAKFDDVVTGFDKLPGETKINRGTINFVEFAGSANAYTATMHQTVSAYVDGMEIIGEVNIANTGSSTLNVDSVGAKSIKHGNGDNVESEDLPAGSMVYLLYHEDDDCFYILGSDRLINRINSLETSITSLMAGSGCPVSANDISASYLNGKLVAGAGITFTENNDGGDETLEIEADGSILKVSATDSTGGYVGDKISSGNHVTLSTQNTGGDEHIEIETEIYTLTQASTGTLTTAQVNNSIIDNFGQTAESTITMPTASDKMAFIYQISTTAGGAVHLKAGADDKFYLDGVALDNADKISLDSPSVGDCATIWTFQTGSTSYDWVAASGPTSWSDGGA